MFNSARGGRTGVDIFQAGEIFIGDDDVERKPEKFNSVTA
jgi:hypothetical protein